MAIFLTVFEFKTRESFKIFKGPYISAISFKEAEILRFLVYPYCKVEGELIEVINAETGKRDKRGSFINTFSLN